MDIINDKEDFTRLLTTKRGQVYVCDLLHWMAHEHNTFRLPVMTIDDFALIHPQYKVLQCVVPLMTPFHGLAAAYKDFDYVIDNVPQKDDILALIKVLKTYSPKDEFFLKANSYIELLQRCLHQAGVQMAFDMYKRENMYCSCGMKFPDYSERYEIFLKDIGLVYEEAMKKYEIGGFEQQTFKAAGLIDAARSIASKNNVPILPKSTPASWKQAWANDKNVMFALEKMTFPAPQCNKSAADLTVGKQFERMQRLIEEAKRKNCDNDDDDVEPADSTSQNGDGGDEKEVDDDDGSEAEESVVDDDKKKTNSSSGSSSSSGGSSSSSSSSSGANSSNKSTISTKTDSGKDKLSKQTSDNTLQVERPIEEEKTVAANHAEQLHQSMIPVVQDIVQKREQSAKNVLTHIDSTLNVSKDHSTKSEQDLQSSLAEQFTVLTGEAVDVNELQQSIWDDSANDLSAINYKPDNGQQSKAIHMEKATSTPQKSEDADLLKPRIKLSLDLKKKISVPDKAPGKKNKSQEIKTAEKRVVENEFIKPQQEAPETKRKATTTDTASNAKKAKINIDFKSHTAASRVYNIDWSKVKYDTIQPTSGFGAPSVVESDINGETQNVVGMVTRSGIKTRGGSKKRK
uniref:Uncharacterized protein n=1 Tax=Trichogramma kaykai TaxID=54128 RepID=A0ABD2W7G6_9HYME